MDFDFQRYIQSRQREGGGGAASAGSSYAYEGDRRVLRALGKARPVRAALEASAKLTEGDLTALFGEAEALEPAARERLEASLARAAARLKAPSPRLRVARSLPGAAALALVVAGEAVIVVDAAVGREAEAAALDFLLGRQLGHLQQEHGAYLGALLALRRREGTVLAWAAKPAALALERWAEAGRLTADRAGLLACGDRDAAVGALIREARGWAQGPWDQLAAALEEGWEEEPPKDGALAALAAVDPALPARVRALLWFSEAAVFRAAQGQSGGEALSAIDRRVSGLTK
jgi:hypothetical protein